MEVREPSAKYLARPGYRQTEVGVIPEDWEVRCLAAVTDPNRPISYGIVQTGTAVQDGVRCLRVVDIDEGRIDGHDLITTSRSISEAYKRTVLRVGDLVMPLRGKVGDAALIGSELAGCNLTRGVALIAIAQGCSSSYCKHFLSSPAARARLVQSMSGSALQEVSIATLRGFQVAFPSSSSEQQAIADALGDADALIESLEHLLAKQRLLRQATMQALLTGERRLPGFEGAWCDVRLSDWGRCHRGVSYNPSADLATSDEDHTVRLLRSNNVQDAAIVLAELQYVQERCVSPEQLLQKNDLLICMANGSKDLVGKTARFEVSDGHRYSFGAFMGVFRPDASRVDPHFAGYAFHTESYRLHIALLLAGSSINNLTPGSIESFCFSAPADLAEQTAIATVLSDLDAEIAALEARIAKAGLVKQGMMQELLTGRIRLV